MVRRIMLFRNAKRKSTDSLIDVEMVFDQTFRLEVTLLQMLGLILSSIPSFGMFLGIKLTMFVPKQFELCVRVPCSYILSGVLPIVWYFTHGDSCDCVCLKWKRHTLGDIPSSMLQLLQLTRPVSRFVLQPWWPVAKGWSVPVAILKCAVTVLITLGLAKRC